MSPSSQPAQERRAPASIYYVDPARIGPLPAGGGGGDGDGGGSHAAAWQAACRRAQELGLDALMMPVPWLSGAATPLAPLDPDRSAEGNGASGLLQGLAGLADLCSSRGLQLLLSLSLERVDRRGVLAQAHPDWYGGPGDEQAHGLDPRLDATQRATLQVRADLQGRAPAGFVEHWAGRLGQWAQAGVTGFCCVGLGALAADDWRELIRQVRAHAGSTRFLGWTPGLPPDRVAALAGTGLDAVFLSLPWWDYRAVWLAEEHARLAAVGSVITPLADPFSSAAHEPLGLQHALRAVAAAETAGDALMVPMDWDAPAGDADAQQQLRSAVAQAAHTLATTPLAGRLHALAHAGGHCAALVRGDGWAYPPARDEPSAAPARLALFNPDASLPHEPDWEALRALLPDGYARLQARSPEQKLPEAIAPAGAARLAAARTLPVATAHGGREGLRRALVRALAAPRVVIASVSPSVEEGRFALKRTLGQPVEVEADIFVDGHDRLAAVLLWRAADENEWREAPMRLQANDRWQGSFVPDRLGQHYYTVRAWRDTWGSYTADLAKKHAAGVDVTLDAEEGRLMLASALGRLDKTKPATARTLSAVLRVLGQPQETPARKGRPAAPADPLPKPTPEQIETLLAERTAIAMEAASERAFDTVFETTFPVWVDRPAAAFASWYELFPRSQSGDPARHGTFDDVIARLPAIRDMGFDVLYFPPIHPIGRVHRKGRNNSLKARPGDPGSPYAIGAAEGGHDALHPELGTLEDFARLVTAARAHGLEIALDFAIQCSPDHPWLAAHPEWFAWRPDGSMRYAENPPKKYEDIVNVDFYGTRGTAARQAALWRALRDVVLFWVDQGVRTFRVDNPHTKPLPFWEWLIADVRGRHPETVFLSEAFTRPKMMYRLAKLGYTQSYTYFTWRESKADFIEYLTELTAGPPADFFRPNFFVNTPDINPRHLQSGGRPAFLIRAALATTLSGLWGMYSGFELCEATPVPGKEEYLDSEKYEIRAWDWNRPGNIVAEIAQLNRIRRSNPALHSHLGLRFHPAGHGSVLFFSKATPDRSNVVLVAINLDPHADHGAQIELPMWLLGQPDHGALEVHDLLYDHRYTWHGKQQYLDLPAGRPYRIWRVQAPA